MTVVVGMSGGVDSSVAALLLKRQGYRVIGLFMKNWEEKDERGICLSSLEYEDVIKVCNEIKIPYYSVSFTEEYRENVFKHFLQAYQAGYTPNPDILCNREIKFKLFLEKAFELGADFLATGHYCQTDHTHLIRGIDPEKDQSYFLYTLQTPVLQKVLFPIGSLYKSEVREMARKYDLPTFEKKDSTGICFIGKRNFKPFLGQYIAFTPGNIETVEGKVVGKHDGIAFHTIGQRKGLKIGGRGEAWYVVGKDLKRNVVLVGQGADHPALFCDTLQANELTWVTQDLPAFPLTCTAKIRYRQQDQSCVLEKIEAGKASVSFHQPQRAITVGQSIVFYEGKKCLGGGVICKTGSSYFEQEKNIMQ